MPDLILHSLATLLSKVNVVIDQQNDFKERLTLLETRSRSRSASAASMPSELFDLSESDDNMESDTAEEWFEAIHDTESSFKRKLPPIPENDISESEYFSGSEVSYRNSATEAEWTLDQE